MLYNAHRGWGRGFDRSNHVQLVNDLFSGVLRRAEDALAKHVRLGLELELGALRDLKQTTKR